MTVRLRAPLVCGVPDNGTPRADARRKQPQNVAPAASGQLSLAGSCGVHPADAGSEARHFAMMRWTPVSRPWQRAQPRKGEREPSSPFPIMNWARLDQVKIPTFDILLSLRIQKTCSSACNFKVICQQLIRSCA